MNGMHPEDLNALTEYWHRETNYINDKVDVALKSAQDNAYACGYRRGREDLIEIRKQRDELAMALEICANAIELRFGKCYELSVARAALASVKGGL